MDTPGVPSEPMTATDTPIETTCIEEPAAAPAVEPETAGPVTEAPPLDNFDWHVPEGQTGYSWVELNELSQSLAHSSMVPAVYRNRPQNIIFAAVAGQELGWGVTTAMRFVHVIDGKPSISPEGMLALIRRAGHSVKGESSSEHAKVTGVRRDNGDEMTVSFTRADAERAKLWHKDNWKMYPEAMLWARAVAMLARRLFSDVFLGAAYVPDEMGAITNERGEPIETTGRDADEPPPEPDWDALKWGDKDHAWAAMLDTKRLLDMLPTESKTKVRDLCGPKPPDHMYSLNIWAMRHAVVVNEAREIGVIGPNDPTTPNLTALDGPVEVVARPDAPTGLTAEDAADAAWVADATGSTVAPPDDPGDDGHPSADDDDLDDARDELDADAKADLDYGTGGMFGYDS